MAWIISAARLRQNSRESIRDRVTYYKYEHCTTFVKENAQIAHRHRICVEPKAQEACAQLLLFGVKILNGRYYRVGADINGYDRGTVLISY
jgi:hypothetical protein